jgi:hypothetical protein
VIPAAILQYAIGLARTSPVGAAFAELGVYKGGAAVEFACIARERMVPIYLFDTFTGIPFQDEGDGHKVGDFGDTSVEAVREAIPDAIIVKGIFPDSLLEVALPRFSFVHVDCDQYRSVQAACAVFSPLMIPGGLMLFDDYNQLASATRAVDEAALFPLHSTPHGRAFWRKPGDPGVLSSLRLAPPEPLQAIARNP